MTQPAQTDKPKRAKKVAPVAAPETFVCYKGFSKDLTCHGGFQYEVGKTYVHTGAVVQCRSGFHVCQNPMDVWDFYGLENGNRFGRVSVGGKIDRSDDKKWAAAEITISAELTLPQIIADAIKFVKALATSGDTIQSASGHYSKLAASGHSSQLAASGDYSKLAASGHYSKLAASGHSSQLEITGKNSAAAAVGPGSIIKAIDGCPITICEWVNGKPVGFVNGVVGQDGIEAGKWYRADGGRLVAC